MIGPAGLAVIISGLRTSAHNETLSTAPLKRLGRRVGTMRRLIKVCPPVAEPLFDIGNVVGEVETYGPTQPYPPLLSPELLGSS